MSAEFQARFARRFGCTVDLVKEREFTSVGQGTEKGGSCAKCGGCAREFGDVGIAAEGVALENSVHSGLELRWACPRCGNDVYEATTLLNSIAQAKGCIADPLCFKCRKDQA